MNFCTCAVKFYKGHFVVKKMNLNFLSFFYIQTFFYIIISIVMNKYQGFYIYVLF